MDAGLRRRVVGAFMFLGVLGTMVVDVGCEQKSPAGSAAQTAPVKELVVLTPHSEAIRDAFAQGFWNWHMTNRGAPVRITWIYRGTPQCVEYVRSAADLQAQEARITKPDVMFGGGAADHSQLAAEGQCRKMDLGDVLAAIPADVNGAATRDPQGRWFATGMRSFGILYNGRACQERGIAPPATWADLADPRFCGWIALADPVSSGSHHECMLMILQREGWAQGWATILRVLANARALNARSGDALRQVESGVSLATFAVNFDGMAAAAESGGALQYVDPAGATAVAPDVMSVLANTANAELARDFVRYVLSEEGQSLWAVRRDSGTTSGATLYHYPILPAVYEKYADRLAMPRNPLREDFGMKLDAESAAWHGALLGPVVQAACRNGNHVRLQQAWRAVIDAGLPAESLTKLTAPPLDEAGAREAATRLQKGAAGDADGLLAEWTTALQRRYTDVLAGVRR